MSWDAYRARLLAANPLLAKSETMSLSVDSFLACVKRAFEAGQLDSRDTQRAANDFEDVKHRSPADTFDDLFRNLFGRKL